MTIQSRYDRLILEITLAHQISDFQSLRCPCGAEPRYIDCCGRFLDNGEIPDTAEILMRSRYTAYTLQREKYLLATWHPSTRPSSLELTQPPIPHWLGLTIKRHLQSGTDHAIVEFVARYKFNGKADRLHEISRFIREKQAWCYIDGDILAD